MKPSSARLRRLAAGSAAAHGVRPPDPRRPRRPRPSAQAPATAARDLTMALLDRARSRRAPLDAEGGVAGRRRRGGPRPPRPSRGAGPARSRRGAPRRAARRRSRERLPAEARDLVEETIEATGELEVMHVDHVDAARRPLRPRADDAHRAATLLHFAGAAPDGADRQLAHVRGVQPGDAIVVDGAAEHRRRQGRAVRTRRARSTRSRSSSRSRTRRRSQPYTKALRREPACSARRAAYELRGVVPADHAHRRRRRLVHDRDRRAAAATTRAIATQARAAAQAAGYVVADYARLVYIFPSTSCSLVGPRHRRRLAVAGVDPHQVRACRTTSSPTSSATTSACSTRIRSTAGRTRSRRAAARCPSTATCST